MIAYGHVRQKALLEDPLVDGLEGVRLSVLPHDDTFLIDIGRTSGSTAILTPHMSIFSPGELIHFRVFKSSSLLECNASYPSCESLHPI
jgi:hypothetical protein